MASESVPLEEPQVAASLGDRMKGYEAVSRGLLVRRCPVIVRVDGRAFHTWTRGREKPFDEALVAIMREAAALTAHEMQGCVLAYIQSDEASFLLTDWSSVETQPWFGYVLSKVVSLSASSFTAFFNQRNAIGSRPATFDARAFNVPHEDVANYFLWRARDWRRNSILGLAQAHFSPKQLHGVNQAGALAMLAEKGVDWSQLKPVLRCGSFYLPKTEEWECIEPAYSEVSFLVGRSLAAIAEAGPV